MKKILKEPFLHFIVLGIFLFVLYGWLNEKTDDKNTIIINDFDVSSIISKWEMQWKRPPTEKELENSINLNIKQEIFYQEALKMNFDHNDEIIKRRLAQKMQFLSNDIASMIEPTNEELKKYYQEHEAKYIAPPTYTIYQITFSPDDRKDHLKDATETLKKHPDASFNEMKELGDALPFNYYYENINAGELGLQLGSNFAEELNNVGINQWTGPIKSGFGYHLVYIVEKTPPTLPDFELIKSDIIRDYEYDYQNEINETIYQDFKKQYEIIVEIKSEDFDPNFVNYLQEELNK